MKKIFVTLALLCALIPTSFGQCIAPVRPLYSPCASTENPIGGLSLEPYKVWFVFETCWTDAGPKTISATLNGQTLHSVFRTIYEPGVDSITLEYFPIFPWGTHYNVNVAFAIFNPGENTAYYESSYDPMGGRVYSPPAYFNIEQSPVISGDQITVDVHAEDWNLATNMFYDCGYKKSEVEVRLVRCSDDSVIASERQPQSIDLSDHHTFVFDYSGSLVELRAEASLIHTEDSIAGEFGPSMSGVVATDQSPCFTAGDISTEIVDPATHQTVVFPNPFDDVITVNNSGRPEHLVISDMSGKTVWIGVTPSNGVVSLRDLPVGMYLCRVGNETPQRIVKH